MGLLEKLRLGRRKIRPVGDRLETGFDDSVSNKRRRIATQLGVIVALVAATLFAFPGDEFKGNVHEGEIWNSPSLVAPYSFSIQKDPAQLAQERDDVRLQVPPLFEPLDGERQTALNRDTVAEQLDGILSAYEGYVVNDERGIREQAIADSSTFVSLRNIARAKLSEAQWGRILDDFSRRSPGMPTQSREELSGLRLDTRILNEAFDQAILITGYGAIDLPLDSIYADHIIVRSESQNAETERPKSEIFGLNEAYEMALANFEEVYQTEAENVNIAMSFFRAIFQPSFAYMPQQTQRRIAEKRDRIAANEGAVERGEIIVQQGDLVTAETLRKISSLEHQQELRTGNRVGWRIASGRLILTLATFFFFFMYLYVLRRKIFDDNGKVLLISILFIVIIALFALVVRLEFATMFVVPVAIASVILTVIFDSRVALFGTITLALIGGQLIHFDYEYTFATIIAGALAIYSVRDIKNRSQFFVSSGIVFVGYAIVLVALFLVQGTSTEVFVRHLIQSGLNSFLIIMAFPLLWVFEKAFDITTDLTLLELSDTNRPLLKELSVRAPGTFNHTLQVANLAEAAADAIGANALLTRVGALYHDIGKMAKPEYFVENQHPGANPHDNLKPRMSALIIISHVKEGIEIAHENNLPQLVEEFIPTHHGTSLIEYFYQRAKDNAADGEDISESEFRYPGPRPNSKESGILMLADSVEAASRSIESPSHKRFEGLIDGILSSRIADDQLALTNLTFRELTTIKETFLNMLVSMYHVRVKYPGQDDESQKEVTDGADSSEASMTGGDSTTQKPSTPVKSTPAAATLTNGKHKANSPDPQDE